MSTGYPAFPTDMLEWNAGFFLPALWALSPGRRSPMTSQQQFRYIRQRTHHLPHESDHADETSCRGGVRRGVCALLPSCSLPMCRRFTISSMVCVMQWGISAMPLTVTTRSISSLACAFIVLAGVSRLSWLSPRPGYAEEAVVEVAMTTVISTAAYPSRWRSRQGDPDWRSYKANP